MPATELTPTETTSNRQAARAKVVLEWFTAAILPDGQQLIAIRPALATDNTATVVLNRCRSILVNAVLNALANAPGVEWSAARQACLRAFYEVRAERPNHDKQPS